jgi:hypothetical protein
MTMDLCREVRAAAIAIVAAVTLAGVASANVRESGTAHPTGIRTIDVARRIDVNNISMFLTNEGSFAYDVANLSGYGGEGLFYPKGAGKTAVFAAGPWISGIINDTLHVTVAEYSQEWGPGNVSIPGSPGNPAGTSAPHSNPDFVEYKMVRWTGDPADSAHVTRSAADLAADPAADPLVHHSWSEYMSGAAPYGAPTRIYRLPNPASPGDSIDVPGPDVAGDMMCWSVYNDADGSRHTNEAGTTQPMGLEVQQTTFAYNRQGALGNTIFLKYRIINKGINNIHDMYFSQWCDPDLGGFTDDLVGCDTLPDRSGKPRSLGYCYNSTNNDQEYGSAPPAVGFDFFQGPRDSLGAILPMTSFNKYVNGTDPQSYIATRNYQLGLNSDSSDVIDPFGKLTRFNVAGDPVAPGPADWLDNQGADKRMMLSSGPFRMLPGDTQTVVVGLVIGQGNDRLSSVSGLRFNDDFAQAAFDSSFNLPSPPAQPKVVVSQDHGKVTLSWDAASRTSYVQPGYKFEGYNVYQGSTVAGPWKRLQTFDEIDNIRVIFDQFFDPVTGQLITAYPVAYGSDDGIQFSYSTTQDAVRGGGLHDGTQYYFAITSYSYNPTGLPKVLENAQAVVRVMPQRAAGGTNLNTAGISAVTYLQKDPSKPPATDVVSVNVVNPEKVTGHTYKVTFQPNNPPIFGMVGSDTATVKDSWSLTDSTTGAVLLSGQLNRRGDSDYRVVDGIQVIESGAYFPKLQSVVFSGTPQGAVPLGAVNFGMGFFGGGADAGANFLGSTIDPAAQPDSFTSVEIRFGVQQNAYRYFRCAKASDGSAPPQGRAYTYGGFWPCNFQVWDTVHNRQLDAFFVERMLTADDGTFLPLASQPPSQDSTWDPGAHPSTTDGLGDREYLFVVTTPYSATPKAAWAQDGVANGNGPEMYAITAVEDSVSGLVAGEKLTFTWANPATPNDVYAFSTTKLAQNNAALAKVNLARIRAVPNPYYSHSAYELNQFNRIIRFVNLPEACTIRIFNLAGQLVRTLHKTDPTVSVLDWNILTDSQLPVGSGVYIYHVDAPGVGTIIGRMAIFMEKERLNNF